MEGVSIHLEIEAKSINMANRMRDDHLRNPDFFDVARFPKITFQSSQARREGDRVLVKGTLTMHGVSRELEIPFVAAEGRNGADMPTRSYRAPLSLDRLAFNLGADSVAAKISLKKDVQLNLMLVGFFEEAAPQAHVPQGRRKRNR